MKFKLPESLDGLDLEALNKLVADALAEYTELAAIDDAEITDEQLDDLTALGDAIESVNAQVTVVETAATERAEKLATAREKLTKLTPAPEAEVVEPVVDPEPTPDAVVDPATIAEIDAIVPESEKEPIVASGNKRPVVGKAVAGQVTTVETATFAPRTASMFAAVDVPGVISGSELPTMKDAAKAFASRLKSFPSKPVSGMRSQQGVAIIKKDVDSEFALTGNDEHDYAVIMEAARESRLPQKSLVASGGWCAPSPTVYDLCQWETVDGILDVPEINITRGGINFTKGPDFSTIYSEAGFVQTETEAEAGTTKPFAEIDCPSFTDVRLDAIGYGLTAPILTNAAWPELIRRYLEGTLVAHQHKVNARIISKIVAFLGSAVNATELGSATSDTLNAVELAAMRIRYKYRLAQSASIDGFAPFWLISALRADLSYRTGIDFVSVTDQMIKAWFAVRNINLQWVYDWQDLAATGVALPTSVQVALYPAGAFVVGKSDVISLDAVYDSTNLAVNNYIAAFFEEGLLVANTCGGGTLVEIALNYHGLTGAANITGS